MAKKRARANPAFKKWGKGPSCFGFFLVVLGLLWLAKDLGYITVPIWPVAAILLGLCLIAKKHCR